MTDNTQSWFTVVKWSESLDKQEEFLSSESVIEGG